MSIPRLMSAATLAALALSSLPVAAQFAKPEDAVKYRKAGMTLMATHLGRIGAVAQGRVPYDASSVQANADLIATLSKLPYAAFVEGTASNDKFGAKANIWTERAKFDAAAKRMQEAVAKLQAAAQSNSLDPVKTAFGEVGAACKACHDDFRN